MVMRMNNNPTKKIAAMHDLSGFGRCALTVIIPILSAMKYQAVPLPTAVLSTHTGGFRGFSFLDLTQQMGESARHWSRLGLKFDAVYSGFLGNEMQTDIVAAFIKHFKDKDTIAIIDPVMGDNGVPYSTITTPIRDKMRKLVCKADIITPNVTEACFLLNRQYKQPDDSALDSMLEQLASMGPQKVVLTGINIDSEHIGTASFDLTAGRKSMYLTEKIDKSYPGTGDIFASVLLGKLMDGLSLEDSAAYASEFTQLLIKDTALYDIPEREGVLLEKNLYRLMER